MASRTLYPPIVNSFEPAFVAGSGSQLRVYFSLSSLSSNPTVSNLTVHASIMRKDGVKVINTKNDVEHNRYRATGIILNLVPQRDTITNNNYYFVTINNDDLDSSVTLSGTTYKGWIPGWAYKIQLRLSTVTYPGGDVKQAAWLQEHSNDFSEWSTICYTKAIAEMALQIPLFDYDSMDKTQSHSPSSVHYISSMDLTGSLGSSVVEADEDYHYINVKLYKDERLLEDSGEVFKTEFSNTYFSYEFKTKIEEDERYQMVFTYETENGYVSKPLTFTFVLNVAVTDRINAYLVTIDDDEDGVFGEEYSLLEEEDAGRLGLKIVSPDDEPFFGNICIRRASAVNNFATWEDIKIFTLKNQYIKDYPIIYDYTIESGVWYKYGIQLISTAGERGELVEMEAPVQRRFEYSFLLGQNNQQLRLQFDNLMNSFKYQIYDSKTDTIGSKYTFIARNAVTYYRTFPVTGLISMWMDEDNLFLLNGKKDVYEYNNVIQMYEDYNIEHGIMQRDFTYERDFRQKVLDFLQDGKPKLFKSPSEGNIIIRLTDVNCNPNKTMDRLIYSFSANANEIDEATMLNYLKYGFYNPGSYSVDFSVLYTYLGQLTGKFKPTDNIFKLIYEKYDSQGRNYGGNSYRLENITRVKITINDPPFRVRNNNGDLVIGNNFRLISHGNTSTITIYDPRGIYEFDSLLEFSYLGSRVTGNDALYLLGDADGQVTEIDATIDFLYGLSVQPYVPKEIKERKPVVGVGQFFEEVAPGTSIFNSIYYRNYIDSDTKFRHLENLSSIEIEANPFTVFAVKDSADDEVQYHEIGETGVLNLHELSDIVSLSYVGKRYPKEMYDESTVSTEIITSDVVVKDAYGNDVTIKAAADVNVTYVYTAVEGYYKE